MNSINLDKLHTTDLGIIRIKKNLHIETDDVVSYIKSLIINEKCDIYQKGKNTYCKFENILVTINSSSYTIITAHIIN